ASLATIWPGFSARRPSPPRRTLPAITAAAARERDSKRPRSVSRESSLLFDMRGRVSRHGRRGPMCSLGHTTRLCARAHTRPRCLDLISLPRCRGDRPAPKRLPPTDHIRITPPSVRPALPGGPHLFVGRAELNAVLLDCAPVTIG